MVISLIGNTEKRPVIYTLLKIFTKLGQDTLLVSDNLHYRRLFIDTEKELSENAGHFLNTLIVITTASPDEAYNEIGFVPGDFDHVIYDNKMAPDSDLTIFIQGAQVTESENSLLEYLETYQTIEMGFGKKPVPYTVPMFKNLEIIESQHMLLEVDKKMTMVLAEMLSENLNMPVKMIAKVVGSK